MNKLNEKVIWLASQNKYKDYCSEVLYEIKVSPF